MASSSSGGYVSRYDVFLSFRGEDTRDSFTDHLYQALRRAGVYTFRDNDAISRGEDLKPEIERGIRESRASVIVLSENYATSRWCLDELCLILQERKERNHFVLPIFYHVDTSDVKGLKGKFNVEVDAAKKRTKENVERWNKALQKVGDITGRVVSGPETDFLTEIVDIIKERLDLKHIYRQANLIGMESRDTEINSWLEQSNCNILAIWGMGGSGKTTLARHIAYTNWQKFENISILYDIGYRSKEELHQLREKLVRQIIEDKQEIIPSVWQGTSIIGKALERKRVLMILDNVRNAQQLEEIIADYGRVHKTKSKIIITTRERHPSLWLYCKECEMQLLTDSESSELFGLHAFKGITQTEAYAELTKKALAYCQGSPLALEVLGSSLSRDSTKQFWESTLNKLEREIHRDIKNVLKTGYNSLPQGSDKELFLHIACFFVGEDKDYVEKILERDCFAISGIVTLTNSCLLSISPNNKLMMHRLLQEMAKIIVYEESPKQPGQRTRVWRNEESYDVLSNGKGSTNVEGLALDMILLGEQRSAQGKRKRSDLVSTVSFEKMDSLKLLHLNQLKVTGSFNNIFKELRWLCWREFFLEAIPHELDMENLVAIDMSCSKLEVFQPPDVLPLLQILNLTNSQYLVEIRNFSLVPKLDTLILENCRRLVRVCDTLGDLTDLTLLNLTGCQNLCKKVHPDLFRLPNSLERLFVEDCNIEDTNFSLSFEDQPLLENLNLAKNLFKHLPSYTHLNKLRVLELRDCRTLTMLLYLPSELAELYIYYCDSLERVTFNSHKFTLQNFGYEGCVNLSEVEDFFKLVPVSKLTETNLGHMKWLREYQDLEVCLVGDDQLTKGRSSYLQMLYEYNIMSISLPDIVTPTTIPEYEYTSESQDLSFHVPSHPKNRTLKGLNITFKYTMSGDEWVWFAKLSSNRGVELIYNAKVFGKPASEEAVIWLSYWPIGKKLNVGDKVDVSIVNIEGLRIQGCGASLVYADEEDENEFLKDASESFVNNNESFEDANDSFEDSSEYADILGVDISGFKLSTGTYYLCRRDYCQFMEIGRLTRNWFSKLVGDTIDCTEVGRWRKTSRSKQPHQSFTKVKNAEVYTIAEGSKSVEVADIVEYDVFLSTVGTGDYNASWLPNDLFMAFQLREVRVFRTEQFLQRDEALKSMIKTTIKNSKASIVILAEKEPSTWDLDELSWILDQRRNTNLIVIPIFYHIKPTDVVNHTKYLDAQVDEFSEWTAQNVTRWKAALTEVAHLDGVELHSGVQDDIIGMIHPSIHLSDDIKKIFNTVRKALRGQDNDLYRKLRTR